MAEKAPVISPAELAALIGRNGSKGFAATPMGRALHGDESAAFRPADLVRRLPEPVAAPETTVTEVPPPPAPPKPAPAPDLDQIRAEAFAKGQAEGFAEGRAAAMAEAEGKAQADAATELAGAVAHLRATAAALLQGGADLQSRLAHDLEQAVLRLASDRAGLTIDANPAAFADRIHRLADRIAQGLRQVEVTLHPDDLAALEGHASLADLPLRPDSNLSRGDVVVRAQGIALSDLILASGDGT